MTVRPNLTPEQIGNLKTHREMLEFVALWREDMRKVAALVADLADETDVAAVRRAVEDVEALLANVEAQVRTGIDWTLDGNCSRDSAPALAESVERLCRAREDLAAHLGRLADVLEEGAAYGPN